MERITLMTTILTNAILLYILTKFVVALKDSLCQQSAHSLENPYQALDIMYEQRHPPDRHVAHIIRQRRSTCTSGNV